MWEAMQYESARYMRPLRDFILSEGAAFQNLQLARDDVRPNRAPDAPEAGLDGWAYMMRTPEKDLAFLYFENAAVLPMLHGFVPAADHVFRWYHPATGEWMEETTITAGAHGTLRLPAFPGGGDRSSADWAARIVRR